METFALDFRENRIKDPGRTLQYPPSETTYICTLHTKAHPYLAFQWLAQIDKGLELQSVTNYTAMNFCSHLLNKNEEWAIVDTLSIERLFYEMQFQI